MYTVYTFHALFRAGVLNSVYTTDPFDPLEGLAKPMNPSSEKRI